MAELNPNEWMAVFKADDYGWKGKFSAKEVAAMAAQYDPQFRKAPATIGHPGGGFFGGGEEQSAHGWVSELQAVDGMLYAKFDELSPELLDGIKGGKYKGRSVGLEPAKYTKSGVPELWHVAFLGGSTPHATGLLPSFANTPDNLIELTYGEEVPAEKPNSETGNEELKTNPDTGVQNMDKVEELERKLDQLTTQVSELSKRPDIGEKELVALKTKADKAAEFETANQALTKERDELRQSSTEQEVEALFSALRKDGRMIPAFENLGLKDAMIALKSLAEGGNGHGTFTLAGKPVSFYDTFASMLEALPQIVPLGEIAPEGASDSTPMAKKEGYIDGADDESNRISVRAGELMAADPKLGLEDAQDKAYEEVVRSGS